MGRIVTQHIDHFGLLRSPRRASALSVSIAYPFSLVGLARHPELLRFQPRVSRHLVG